MFLSLSRVSGFAYRVLHFVLTKRSGPGVRRWAPEARHRDRTGLSEMEGARLRSGATGEFAETGSCSNLAGEPEPQSPPTDDRDRGGVAMHETTRADAVFPVPSHLLARLRSFPSSLQARLMLIIVAALLPALGLALYNAAEQRKEAAARVSNEVLVHAQNISSQLQHQIEHARTLALILSQSPAVREPGGARCGDFLGAMEPELSAYTNVMITDPDGAVYCSRLPLSGPVNLGDREYFKEALRSRGLTVSDYVLARVVDKPIMTIAVPILDELDTVEAILVLGLDLDVLYQTLAHLVLPRGSTATMLDRDGMVLARYPDADSWVGKPMPDGALAETVTRRPAQPAGHCPAKDRRHRHRHRGRQLQPEPRRAPQ